MEQKITTKTDSWFLTTITYQKVMEDGVNKKVKELYTLPALSFTEAEAGITDEMKYCDELDVADISKAPFGEIIFTDNEAADHYYKVKANFITLDEKTGKKKKSPVLYLVQAASTKEAQRNFDEVMSGTMIDYVVESVIETKIIDVFTKE